MAVLPLATLGLLSLLHVDVVIAGQQPSPPAASVVDHVELWPWHTVSNSLCWRIPMLIFSSNESSTALLAFAEERRLHANNTNPCADGKLAPTDPIPIHGGA